MHIYKKVQQIPNECVHNTTTTSKVIHKQCGCEA